MKHWLLAILTSCNTYTGVVINKFEQTITIETVVEPNHYVFPLVTIDEFDSIHIGDTLIIDKLTLRIINKQQ
jgi:hypothetical protein